MDNSFRPFSAKTVILIVALIVLGVALGLAAGFLPPDDATRGWLVTSIKGTAAALLICAAVFSLRRKRK